LVFFKEEEDGSAVMNIEYDEEAHQALMQKAIETILLEFIKSKEEELGIKK
jgi:predicted fused transcriptional regulator/phosphomethylpyrimidine kinase